jgi:hypothetical protein
MDEFNKALAISTLKSAWKRSHLAWPRDVRNLTAAFLLPVFIS